MNEDLVRGFLNEQTSEDAQNSMDNASSNERISVEVSGTYRMKVDTFGYVKDNETKVFSCFDKSSQKGVLQLVVPLRVVDGTPLVPKGSLMFFNINMAPAPGAKKETIQTMARMAKPKLVAMLGHENIRMDATWLVENLTPEFVREGDKVTMKRDHKLKMEVMVKVVDDWYNSKPKLRVDTIVPAGHEDRSMSNDPKKTVTPDTSDPSDIDYSTAVNEDDGNISAEKMVENSIEEGEHTTDDSPDLPSKVEDF